MLPDTAISLPLVRYCAIVSAVFPKATHPIKSVSSFLNGLFTATVNLHTAEPLPAANLNSGSFVNLPTRTTLFTTIPPMLLP